MRRGRKVVEGQPVRAWGLLLRREPATGNQGGADLHIVVLACMLVVLAVNGGAEGQALAER